MNNNHAMWTCEACNLEFDTFQGKANHVRWKHKEQKFSEEGRNSLRVNIRKLNEERYGTTTRVTETRTCKCGQAFEVTYSLGRRGHVKKTCSKQCAARREFTKETNEKRKATCKAAAAKNPNAYRAMLLSNRRCSSKAERALAEKLAEFGFKRHKHISAEGAVFDVDIVSSDERIWIESDGEWHFRQVHAGHNFEATKLRDALEESEAIRRNVLLIRVNNQTTSIEHQVEFIQAAVTTWDNQGRVLKLGYAES